MIGRQLATFALTLSLMLGLPVASNVAKPRRTSAQSCNPAVVSYIVRDESGNLLGEAELKSVYEQLPKTIDSARLHMGEVSFAEDGMTFYWPESLDWEKGRKVTGLQFINNETCEMRLGEVTITYRKKSMRLIFNIDIARYQRDRRPVIDSLPFQEGTFSLDLSGWPHDTHKMIPSDRWKKVRDKSRGGDRTTVIAQSTFKPDHRSSARAKQPQRTERTDMPLCPAVSSAVSACFVRSECWRDSS